MRIRTFATALLLLIAASASGFAQTKLVRSFSSTCDSLSVLVKERTSVDVKLRLKSITQRGSVLDFYFTQSLSDIPWSKDNMDWFRDTLEEMFPEDAPAAKVGNIFGNGINMRELVTPLLHFNGEVHDYIRRVEDPRNGTMVQRIGGLEYGKGLSGRHLAVWQSHGRYYETKTSRWEWQRAQYFMTVEDMYTQSYVIPFLIPMLENAGAYVITPRERDTQRNEAVVDNDPSFPLPRTGLVRRSGMYVENGSWNDAGTGFADTKEIYTGDDNPFTMGTARSAKVLAGKAEEAKVTWTPDIPDRGSYAVYVSYRTLPNSTPHAHYTVRHLGGETEFSVNQRMGGGTWVYLGTFEFGKHGGCVILDNAAPQGCENTEGQVVTADAVRFGGGMGKIARGDEDTPVESWETSGMPSYMEGALYSMQWAGVDTLITRKHPDDYTNDFADRGPWTAMMAGGSRVNPKEDGKGIPFDLSLAFHSDAGTFPNDSIVGTLSIYTLKADGSRKLDTGEDRMGSRDLSNYVQSQVVNDIRKRYEPEWARREIWDRSYSESRTGKVPAMILELLSHQNFADMKYGHDPAFRFDVSRAVYKGVLKYLSDRYGCPYEVQPLPVHNFAAVPEDGGLRLSWSPTADPIEPTAVSKGYILYTRIDGGAFDQGRPIEAQSRNDSTWTAHVTMDPGHIYSFRIAAFNDGGLSFPSETLSAGIPENPVPGRTVMVVNNFYRVAAPAWFDTPEYAGFDTSLDSGVPYMYDISYIGEQNQFRRDLEWIDDDNPGFGGSYTDKAGFRKAGNTFDYPYVHGTAVLAAGYTFGSMGSDAFSADPALAENAWAIDLICGKQVTTAMGRGAVEDRYQVFPAQLQGALRYYTGKGGNVLISGSNIGTDVWDRVYPSVHKDEEYTTQTKRFVEDVLGFRWLTNYASRSGMLWVMRSKQIDTDPITVRFGFHNEPNEEVYCVETPDGIVPSDKNGSTFLRYTDTNISAAVCCDRKTYRTISFGFPLETLKESGDISRLMALSLGWFER